MADSRPILKWPGGGDPDAIEAVGTAVREWRRSQGMTLREVAIEMRVTERTLGRWERGQGVFPAWVLYRLNSVYGVSLDQLLGLRQS